MKSKNNQKREEPKEFYLKIPHHILNIPQLGLSEKVLMAHFYSFGAKGCWQSNATLAEMFMVSTDTISRWINRIQKHIYVKCPKGYYRTIWVKSHSDVKAGCAEFRKADKNTPLHFGKNAERPGQKCLSDCRKSAFSLRQECGTTNNNTIKETIKDTTATPAPLPAGGQAPALLEQRKNERQEMVKEFCRRLARTKQPLPKRSPEEFERMRREALEQMERIIAAKRKQAV